MQKSKLFNIIAAAVSAVALLVLLLVPFYEIMGVGAKYKDVEGATLVFILLVLGIAFGVFGLVNVPVEAKVKKLILAIGYIVVGALVFIMTIDDFTDFLELEFSFVLLMPVIAGAALVAFGVLTFLNKEE